MQHWAQSSPLAVVQLLQARGGSDLPVLIPSSRPTGYRAAGSNVSITGVFEKLPQYFRAERQSVVAS